MLADTPLQHGVDIGDSAFGVADRVGCSRIRTIDGSHSSASLGSSTLGCWRRESSCGLNLRFKRINVVFVGCGATLYPYKCRGGGMIVFPTSVHVFCGAGKGI